MTTKVAPEEVKDSFKSCSRWVKWCGAIFSFIEVSAYSVPNHRLIVFRKLAVEVDRESAEGLSSESSELLRTMTERVQSLMGKLNDCMRKESDEEISKHLQEMIEAFEKVQSFGDAEWKREIDYAAKDEISQVTHLVEEVEDIIDSYGLISISKHKRLRRANSGMNKLSSKIQQFLNKDRRYPRSYGLINVIQEIRILLLGYIMGSGIELQFPDLLKRFCHKVCDDLKNVKPQETEFVSELYQLNDVELIEDHFEYGSDSIELKICCGLDHSVPELTCLMGRQEDICSFQSSLFGKESECVSLVSVAIIGIGGIGKTCLAEAMYKQVKSKFSCYAWINSHGKTTLEILQQTWMLFNKSQSVSSPPLMFEDEVSLSHRIQSYLINKQFLLVLDDISSVSVWKSVKDALHKNNTRGKIILTSRTSDLPDCIHIKPKPLESNEAFDLLSKHAFSGIGSDSESIMKKISTLCCGNPFVIKIVGGMLNSMMPTDCSKLQEVYKRMQEVTKQERGEIEQNSFIPLCYAALPPVLKSGFLYAALFPPQSQMNCKRLMRLWIAEGFTDLKDKSKTKEEIAEQQLRELIRRNLFQVTKVGTNGKPILCQLLRPLREFAIKRSQEDGFSFTSETGSSLPVERPLRLSLIFRHRQVKMNIDKTNYSRLRSLLVLQGSKLHTSFIKPDLVSSLKLVRVLELQDMPIDALPDSLGKLFLMRYLGLRRTKLVELPNSLDNLKDLQTLDVRDTMVRSLPENLEQLTELRHLLLALSFDDKVVNLPVVIADFKQLQSLAGVELTECIAKSLLELPQLQKLSVGKVKSDMLELFAKSINQMVHLRSLSINCDLGEKLHTKFFQQTLTSKMEKLHVRGRILHLLDWVKSLKSLRCLHIWDCLLAEDPFLELGKLPKLEFLSVKNTYIGHHIEFHIGAFPNLKKLSIVHFQALSEWQIGDGAVENLKKLSIENCPKLTKLPPCFRKLANFREMQVRKMPEAFTGEARKFMEEGASFSLVVRS
ncbi:hypothetical protein L6164_012944 [Bauhinia variegata]|uniref:Uncharacterized protein n=1 Tax=Bauhinia variegata TaxID=167791 RepID=A0ACB9PBJ7_BAUVA|nr:hypothetical protein L6164_012944 [Bauhinia variegata]